MFWVFHGSYHLQTCFPSSDVGLSLLDEYVLICGYVSYSKARLFKKVERGYAAKGTEVEVVGMDDSFRTTLTGIGAPLFLYMIAMVFSDISFRNVPQATRPCKS